VKPATPALISYLATNSDVLMVDLYTFVLVGGGYNRYFDFPGTANLVLTPAQIPGSPTMRPPTASATWVRGPGFGRSKVSTKIGLQPAELLISVYGGSSDTINGQTWQNSVDQGAFDGAYVELDRLFMKPGSVFPDTSLGGIVWFYGKVAEVEVSRSEVKITVKSLLNMLQEQQMPRRLWAAPCSHIFGDAGCGYDRYDGRNALSQDTGAGVIVIYAQDGSGFFNIVTNWQVIPNYYSLGTATCIGGVNNGLSRTIDNVGGPNVYLKRQFPHSVNTGDSFQLLPGCDHSVFTCNNVFKNLLRYGGMPYIPAPELAL
jgi:uncharacterized phage protein (TIGR02218 family)